MAQVRFLCLLVIAMLAASLYSLPSLEVYIQHPDSFERDFLSALENTIINAGDYSLDHSYRDSDFDTGEFNGITFATVDDTSEMGYLVFLKAMPLQGTGTPQVAVSLYHTIKGMLFHSEIMQTALGTPQAVAEAVYRERLMFFHPLMQPMAQQEELTYQRVLRQRISEYLTEIIQYWLTPIVQGGAGQTVAQLTKAKLNERLGFPQSGAMMLDTGTVEIISIKGTVVQIKGIPGKKGHLNPDLAIVGVADCSTRNISFLGE